MLVKRIWNIFSSFIFETLQNNIYETFMEKKHLIHRNPTIFIFVSFVNFFFVFFYLLRQIMRTKMLFFSEIFFSIYVIGVVHFKLHSKIV